MPPRAIFGGAATVSLPASFQDVSAVRDVPDTEEVFVDEAERMLAVELLECSDKARGDEAVVDAFREVASWNNAKAAEVESVSAAVAQDVARGLLAPSRATSLRADFVATCVGTQRGVVKFHEHDSEGNDVRVWMALARFSKLNCDVLLSLTVPTHFSPESSSAKRSVLLDPRLGEAIFLEAVASLEMLDAGLFA